MKKIAVLGSGSWGTALAILLSKNGHAVTLWSFQQDEYESLVHSRENLEFLPGIIIPNSIHLTTCSRKAVEDKDIIVIAIPSKFIRSTLKLFSPFIKTGQIIVNVAKGLDEDTLQTLCQVIEQEVPSCPVAVLSGPSHAEEVAKDIPTTVVISAHDKKIAEQIQDVFMTPKFRVYTNPDRMGVELGGALKNVIALAAGISDGLGFGDNTKAALMTRGIVEIARLGSTMGADLQTFSGLSGIGDLIVTCTSMHSRNRRAGILLGQGKSLSDTLKEVHMVVEGVNTAQAALKMSRKFEVHMPIIEQINNVLFHGKDPKQAVVDLMMREKTIEHEMEEMSWLPTLTSTGKNTW